MYTFYFLGPHTRLTGREGNWVLMNNKIRSKKQDICSTITGVCNLISENEH